MTPTTKTPSAEDVRCRHCGKKIACDAGQWYHVETQYVFCYDADDKTEAEPKEPAQSARSESDLEELIGYECNVCKAKIDTHGLLDHREATGHNDFKSIYSSALTSGKDGLSATGSAQEAKNKGTNTPDPSPTEAASLPATMGAGAIRTVACSMPAAAIDEEKAVAEFKKEFKEKLEKKIMRVSTNSPDNPIIQSILNDSEQAARNIFHMAWNKAKKREIENIELNEKMAYDKGYEDGEKKTTQSIFEDFDNLFTNVPFGKPSKEFLNKAGEIFVKWRKASGK